ncbi:hypothetical protein sm9_1102 [Methanobrevibacter millerae]|uniref:Uncharacterized protein n=1 Tax=Methanobrevibacter millerae TaxID=230361 RepID=A0A0U3DSI6_9EURY|nr:hypothetical protein sm9_1102 [Methanobrevibacter millerae]
MASIVNGFITETSKSDIWKIIFYSNIILLNMNLIDLMYKRRSTRKFSDEEISK